MHVYSLIHSSSAAPGDYSALNAQLVFANGQMAGDVVCASLDIINDNVVENNEELLNVTLSADDPHVTTLTATSATIDIRENNNDGNLQVKWCSILSYYLTAYAKNCSLSSYYYQIYQLSIDY